MPRRGLEPPWVTPHAPKACVSASFTTSAFTTVILLKKQYKGKIASYIELHGQK